MSTADLAALVARLEAVTSRLEAVPAGGVGGGGGAAAAGSVEVAPSVLAYDDLINGVVAEYLAASEKVGGPCLEQAKLFAEAFKELRDLLEIASGSKKPDGWPGNMPDNVMAIIQSVGGKIGAIGEIDGFKEKQLEHTKALGDAAGALSWVVMDPTPVPHSKEAGDAAWFNGQKVLMKSKGTDENGVAWANALKAMMAELPPYIKQFHTTGVAWNPKGGDAASFVPGAAVAGGGAAPAAAAAAAPAEVGASVAEFDDVLTHITTFVELSTKIGGKVAEIGAQVDQCFKAQRAFLEMASQSKKPSGWPGCADILAPMSDCMMAIGELSDYGELKNHTLMMGEGIQAAAWVAVEPTPCPHVKETLPASMFYGNKVLVEYKSKDQTHVDWVNTWKAFLTDLADYVKRNHTTGVTWNPKGGDAHPAGAAATPAPAPAPSGGPPKGPGGPPPPPPGPPPNLADLEDKRGGSKPVPNTGALFAELNKGSDITSGLKKVSKQKAASSKVVMKEKKTQTKKKMGTPKLALDGRKWLCEFYIDDRTGNLVISDCDVKQTVTIFRCVNCVVQIKGKINAVLLDDCDKTSIVCSDVVSSIDIVNCTSVEVQADGNVPTIAVDKTDGCQLYLGTTAMSGDGPTIIMSKSSECNVTTPGATEDDDGVEQALPEQFSNLFVNGKWETTPVTHG